MVTAAGMGQGEGYGHCAVEIGLFWILAEATEGCGQAVKSVVRLCQVATEVDVGSCSALMTNMHSLL